MKRCNCCGKLIWPWQKWLTAEQWTLDKGKQELLQTGEIHRKCELIVVKAGDNHRTWLYRFRIGTYWFIDKT